MKSHAPSLAYRWAKYALRQKMPAWTPFVYWALAVVFATDAVLSRELQWFPVAFILAAIQDWQQRGYREIFEEHENRIAELESRIPTERPHAP